MHTLFSAVVYSRLSIAYCVEAHILHLYQSIHTEYIHNAHKIHLKYIKNIHMIHTKYIQITYRIHTTCTQNTYKIHTKYIPQVSDGMMKNDGWWILDAVWCTPPCPLHPLPVHLSSPSAHRRSPGTPGTNLADGRGNLTYGQRWSHHSWAFDQEL